jgi:spermidine synthase
MVIDGFVMLTSLDNFLYHEMMSHPGVFTHTDPKRVVIIVDSTDPIGPAEGLFWATFYRDCHQALGALAQPEFFPRDSAADLTGTC